MIDCPVATVTTIILIGSDHARGSLLVEGAEYVQNVTTTTTAVYCDSYLVIHGSSFVTFLFLLTFPICIFLLPFLCVLPSLLSRNFQNMDLLRFQAGGYRRRSNLGLVCFVLMFAVFLVKDTCLFSSFRFSFSLVMR